MEIVRDFPPIWDEIKATFDVVGRPIIFAWGERIYNPTGVYIDPGLLAHEMMHGKRQGGDIVGWWRRYIEDTRFRLDEEIPAHQAEYIARMKTAHNRTQRRSTEKMIAKRLSSPLYGNIISTAQARKLLKEAA